jgi:hypothetical protein
MVNLPPSAAMFDLTDEASLKDLPGFITEKIRMKAEGEQASRDPEKAGPGKQETDPAPENHPVKRIFS